MSIPNTITYAELLATAERLGGEEGKAKDSQMKFHLACIEGGYHNALNLDANRHGTDIDDATKLAEAYVKGQTKEVIFNAKAPNQRKLIATVRLDIKIGSWPKGGNGEPMATINALVGMRQNFRKDPLQVKKLDDATNMLHRYARAQLKRDTLIQSAELKTFCFKPQKNINSVEEIIEGIRKSLDKLIDGSAAQGTAQDNSPDVVAARHALTKRLTAIATAKGKAQPGGTVAKVAPKYTAANTGANAPVAIAAAPTTN